MTGIRTSFVAFALFIALVAPAAAQYSQPPTGPDAQQRFFTALRSIPISEDQRNAIRSIIGDGYLGGATDDDIDGRIVAVLDPQQARALRDRLGYDPAGGLPFAPPDYRPRTIGVVHKFSGGAITLTNGSTVFTRDSTLLAPARDAIKPGVRIGIEGPSARDGNINADIVRVFDDQIADYAIARATTGGRFDTIAATNKSNLTLGRGKTVFLRDDTVIAPNRTYLQPGANIVVYGVPTSDGNINADRIDVLTQR